VVDADHIIVANDNNLPYSSGRQIGKQDDNEFILLRVPEFLRAKEGGKVPTPHLPMPSA